MTIQDKEKPYFNRSKAKRISISRYMEILKEETEKARTAIDNPYFKFNEEDGVYSFNKREYLLDLPKSRLFEIAKECH